MISPSSQNPATLYYTAAIPDDFRQGDIYSEVLHVMLSEPGFQVLRMFQGRGGRTTVSMHNEGNAPHGGFKWDDSKELVQAEGQLAMAVVLTHDCEIENPDSRQHRLVGILRSLDRLSDSDREVILEGRHFGRLYLPSWPDVGLPESYLDLRRITTLRGDALPEAQRIASMTDFGREVLQRAIIRYLTEKYRA